ncbi:MAG: transposase family protein, partial [Porphyromonas pasteri]
MESSSLISSLSLIDDHRSDKNKRYPLPLLLLIAFCASISKHDSVQVLLSKDSRGNSCITFAKIKGV